MRGAPPLPQDANSSSALPVNVLLRYGLGQTGAQIFRDTPAALLPVFMTTILGIPAWMAGAAILIPKLWVIICDPLMGAWSDRSANKVGRTPFLAVGAILTSLGFYALFSIPDFASELVTATIVSIVFLLSMTAFSAFSVPYLGIAALLSTDTHERTRILVYRMIFVTAGVLLGVGVAQPVVFWFGGGYAGWHSMGLIFGLICLVSMLGSAIGLHSVLKDHKTSEEQATPPLKEQFAALARNKPFRLLLIIHFIQTVGQACSYTVVALVFIYLAGSVELLLPFVIVMSIVGLSVQPLWLSLSKRMGKLPLFVWQVLAWCLITLSWLWIDYGSDMFVALPAVGEVSVKELLILLRGGLIGVTNAGFLLLLTSLFTDSIYQGETGSGAAMEGSYAGIWSASEKLAFALGPLISGVTLSAFGFQSSRGGIIEQDAGALTGIIMSYSVVPMAFFLASMAFVPALNRALKAADQAGEPVPA
ncbi:MFS transporter [Croceicoccus sp. 1NDH52]|nr:MFS transporter [Croceicoccus gelatinilyticus]